MVYNIFHLDSNILWHSISNSI